EIVLAALHELKRAPELALVLVLKELLRGEKVRITAPARERQREVALADAGRGLHQEDARPLGTVAFIDVGANGFEQARLGRTRPGAGRKVGEEIGGRHIQKLITQRADPRRSWRLTVSAIRRGNSYRLGYSYPLGYSHALGYSHPLFPSRGRRPS